MGIEEISIPTTEIEADGFITPPSALEYKNKRVPTNITANISATPISECIYPKCEDCDKYHGHYCTVPMVISKQMWMILGEINAKTMKRLTALENLVFDKLLGDK